MAVINKEILQVGMGAFVRRAELVSTGWLAEQSKEFNAKVRFAMNLYGNPSIYKIVGWILSTTTNCHQNWDFDWFLHEEQLSRILQNNLSWYNRVTVEILAYQTLWIAPDSLIPITNPKTSSLTRQGSNFPLILSPFPKSLPAQKKRGPFCSLRFTKIE